MEKEIQDLIELSHYAAEHPRFVQGGGGNCSVKSGDKMWIKSSGYFLEDVAENAAFSIQQLPSGEPVDENKGKASMESPLHRLLGPYVIHTHPVAVAAFVSSVEGKQKFRELFPEPHFIWVNYAAPGDLLYERVKETLPPGVSNSRLVLFLENHGLFVSSPSKKACIELHEKTVKKLESFFGVPKALPYVAEGRFLTPDHAVYGRFNTNRVGFSDRQKISVDETVLLARHALAFMFEKGWTPRWLPDEDVAFVLGMDQEKYRQQIWGNSR